MRAHGAARNRHGAHEPSPGFRLPAHRRRAAYAVFGALFATGILWFVFHYFLKRAGEFGPEPHPLEIWWLRLHGAAAFAALWLAGLLWGTHARPALRQRRLRASGSANLALLGALAASGYLLYYADDGVCRDAAYWAHCLVGLMLAVALSAHVLGGCRMRRIAQWERIRDLSMS